MDDDHADDKDSDDESVSFSPLGPNHSLVVVSNNAVEIIPNQDMAKLSDSTQSRKKIGSPGDSINTRHVSGIKITKKHAQYFLSAGMMLGIRECVGGMSQISEIETDVLLDENESNELDKECHRAEKFKIPAGIFFMGSKIALPYRYSVKAYAPLVFSKIRANLGVKKQRFLHSICGKDEFIEFISNAKSGQFFFYSHDGRYMIKTQTHEEKTFLLHILPKYYRFMKENPHTFLTHFYGLYRVKMPDLGKCIHFVIMKSVFNTEQEIHKIWDLKGSTLGRRSNRGDGVHKDLDFVDENRKIRVGPQVKSAIMEQLQKDTDFLAKNEIMDYSLLLGVHLCSTLPTKIKNRRLTLSRTNTPMRRMQLENIKDDRQPLDDIIEGKQSSMDSGASDYNYNILSDDDDDDSINEGDDRDDGEDFLKLMNNNKQWLSKCDTSDSLVSTPSTSEIDSTINPYSCREDHGIESFEGGVRNEIYFGGIIDILQHYNTRKWGENIMKRAVGNTESSMSCVNPELYASRFVDFISKLID